MKRSRLAAILVATMLMTTTALAGPAAGDAGASPGDATELVTRATHGSFTDRKNAEPALVAMGEAAVPALIVGAKKAPSEELRKWCVGVLDEMGKRSAADEVQTKTDDALIGVFGAFAEIRDVDALSAIFPFVGAERLAIRNAARAALLAYGDSAASRLRAEYTNIVGAVSPVWTTKQLAEAYFAARDELRLHDVVTLFDRGLLEAKTDLAAGVVDLDAALAREPMLERRREAAAIYVQYASSLAKTDRRAAREYDLKALRIGEATSPDGAHAAGALAFFDADDLRAKGIVDRAAYQHVLAIDPQNQDAKDALVQLDHDRDLREDNLHKTEAAIAAAVGVTAILAALFVGLARRRRSKLELDLR
ncbi:MAG: hypothetical protein ABI461_16340 [Polyangiaceae bacterium]